MYDSTNYGGDSISYTVTSTCNNALASEFNDRSSSLKLTSGCVRLYGDINCAGDYRDFTANTPDLSTLYDSANYAGKLSLHLSSVWDSSYQLGSCL